MTTTASPTHTETAAPASRHGPPPSRSPATYDLTDAPTRHAGLLAWVAEVAELTQPDRIHWVDGSDDGVRRAHRRADRRPAPWSG